MSGTQLSSGHRKGEPTLRMERIGDSPLPGGQAHPALMTAAGGSMECHLWTPEGQAGPRANMRGLQRTPRGTRCMDNMGREEPVWI